MEKGWQIIPILSKPQCEEISQSVKQDVLNTTFGLTKEISNFNKCLNGWELFTNPSLRKEYLSNPECIWQNNFSQKPLVSKSCGMVNIFHNPLVRQHILFNAEVVEAIEAEYGEKVIYAKGSERVSIKPKGSIDMERHMDDNFQNPEKRIQAFVTLEIDSNNKRKMDSIGSIEVLSNFNHYFDYYPLFIEKNPEYDNETVKSSKIPVVLDKTFLKSIEPFNEWLQEKFYSETIKKSYKKFMDVHPIPEEFQQIEWEFPNICKGDLFIWDSKLPHRNTKNKSDTLRIVAYVSLYPISTWENLGKPNILNMFLGKTKSLNGEKNRDNREEKEYYDDDWDTRVAMDLKNPLIKKLLNLK
jgi:hypothetical protein